MRRAAQLVALAALGAGLALVSLSGCESIRGLFAKGEEGAAFKEIVCAYAAQECPRIMAGSPAGKVLCDRALKECSLPPATAAAIRAAK
jgi:hypothetical protein